MIPKREVADHETSGKQIAQHYRRRALHDVDTLCFRCELAPFVLHHKSDKKVWSRAGSIAVIGVLLALAGCAEGAKLVQEHDKGGVVVYHFKEGQGPLLSSFRAEALAIIREKCGDRSYDILREGEAKGRARVVSPIEGQEEIIRERRWGIQFQCR